MNELQVIDERQLLGRQFRVYGTLDEPLFLAKDVAGWIEHSDVSTMLRNIDENEKVTNIVCTPGGNTGYISSEQWRKALEVAKSRKAEYQHPREAEQLEYIANIMAVYG